MGKIGMRLALFIDNIIGYIENFDAIYQKLLELISINQDYLYI